ncbi:unnamed protein product [Closterium sp. NIES-53]
MSSAERVHICQVAMAKECLDTIATRYSTPSSVTLGCLFMPFFFLDLPAFPTVTDLTTHLRSLDTSFHATRLPNFLSPACNALLAMHPMNLIINLFECRLTKIESRLRTIASTIDAVVPPIFEGCALLQLPTTIASAAVAEPSTTTKVAAASTLSGGQGRHMGGHGHGGGGNAGTPGGVDAGSASWVLTLAVARPIAREAASSEWRDSCVRRNGVSRPQKTLVDGSAEDAGRRARRGRWSMRLERTLVDALTEDAVDELVEDPVDELAEDAGRRAHREVLVYELCSACSSRRMLFDTASSSWSTQKSLVCEI